MRLWIVLGLALWAMQLSASAVDDLKMFNAKVRTFDAEFEQTIIDENNKILDKASGRMYLQRPGKFRWEYQRPYEQVIVSNGSKIWLYDKDIEQVSVKTIKQGLGDTPALLLTDAKALESNFVIKNTVIKGAGNNNGLGWIELTPKNADVQFEKILLAFEGERIHTMRMHDKLGQTTTIRFLKSRLNPGLSQRIFDFTPPPDADVVGSGG